MNNSIDSLKQAWKQNSGFDQDNLTPEQIKSFISGRSNDTTAMFKKSLVFDIVFKGALISGFMVLAFLFSDYLKTIIVIWSITGLTLLFLVMQLRNYRKLMQKKSLSFNLRELLQDRINYFNEKYINTIYIGAFSTPLFFIAGSLFYFYFKYGYVRTLDIIDLLVFGAGIMLCYIFNLYAQLRSVKFHINQLAECLAELEDESIKELNVRKMIYKRRRLTVIFILLLLAGILALVYMLVVHE